MRRVIATVVALVAALSWVQHGAAFPKAEPSKSRFARRAADSPPKTLGISDAAAYLGKYGYLSKSKAAAVKVGGIVDASSFEKSIMRMQVMLGLQPTGKLDAETMEMMVKPRCGVEDTVGVSQMLDKGNHAKSKFRNKKNQRKSRRKQKKRRGKNRKGEQSTKNQHDKARSRTKRYSLEGSKWDKMDLTYKINNYTPDMSRAEVDRSIADGLRVWSDVTQLTFRRAARDEKADINVSFGRGNHGDYYPFDGPSGTLAHAFFPQSGESHFDEDERFDFRDGDGVNLMIVAAHEFGHALGLAHSNVPGSLMAPIYQGYVPNYQLDRDDVLAIQQLYGRNERRTTPAPTRPATPRPTRPTPRPTPRPTRPSTTRRPPTTTTRRPRPRPENGGGNNSTEPMDICGDRISFDATFYDDERKKMFAFKGKYYWVFDNEGRFDGYPRLISRRWVGIEDGGGDIQAAAHSRVTGRTYIFKGEKVYRFAGYTLENGFPRPMANLGLPKNPDAAMQWGGDALIYVFKKNNYFRFDEYQQYDGHRRYTHRRITRHWERIPSNIDSAMQWGEATYFMKGELLYKFSDYNNLQVDRRYPKDMRKYFFRCSGKAAPIKFRKRKGKKGRKSKKRNKE